MCMLGDRVEGKYSYPIRIHFPITIRIGIGRSVYRPTTRALQEASAASMGVLQEDRGEEDNRPLPRSARLQKIISELFSTVATSAPGIRWAGGNSHEFVLSLPSSAAELIAALEVIPKLFPSTRSPPNFGNFTRDFSLGYWVVSRNSDPQFRNLSTDFFLIPKVTCSIFGFPGGGEP